MLAAGFIGVMLLLQPTLERGQWLGALFGLGSGIISSVAYLNVRRLGELGEPEWRTVFYFSALSAVGGLPWLLSAGPFHAIDLRGWLLLLGIGAFGVLAQLCMTAAYKRGKTLTSASLAYSTVVFSSIFGMLLWAESLAWLSWAGVALIIASALVHRPEVIVVDEPMIGLDPKSAKLLKTLFRRYTDLGGTVLMSTHTMEIIEGL